MKRFKKMLSLLLVGVIAVTSLFCGTVTASAASSKASILFLEISKIDNKATDIISLGQDIYMFAAEKYRAIYRIGSSEIKKWRNTGKLKATKITIDSEAAKYNWTYNSSLTLKYSDYMVLSYMDKENIQHNCVLKYDSSRNMLSEIYTTINNIGVSVNGDMSEYVWDGNSKKLQLKILNSKAKLVKQLSYDFSMSDCNAWWRPLYSDNKYALVSYYNDSDIAQGNDILIDKNGKEKKIDDLLYGAVYRISQGTNYYGFACVPFASMRYIYSTDKNKMYNLSSASWIYDNKKEYDLCGIKEQLYGTNGIGIYEHTDTSDPNNIKNEYKYVLINVNSDIFLSDIYDYIVSEDNGKTYLAKNSNNTWCYLNSKGKKLATFDCADFFCGNGKYAPVIKGGKIYLINKSMKKVSQTIKADNNCTIWTLNDELFAFTKSGKKYIMTNK